MAWLDLALAILFAALTVIYAVRVRALKRSGDARQARRALGTAVLLGIATVLFAVAAALTLS